MTLTVVVGIVAVALVWAATAILVAWLRRGSSFDLRVTYRHGPHGPPAPESTADDDSGTDSPSRPAD